MMKTESILALVFIATAVMLIGGLAATTLITTAMAAKPDFLQCARAHDGGVGVCGATEEDCELARAIFDIEGRCHKEPIRR